MIIGPILKGITSLGSSWLANRKAKAEHKRELKVIKQTGKVRLTQAKEDNKLARETRAGRMDSTAMNQMNMTWKDEYILLLLSLPVIMCFIPAMTLFGVSFDPQAAALNGFGILDQTPEWYQWSITGIIAAVYGLRTWKRLFK